MVYRVRRYVYNKDAKMRSDFEMKFFERMKTMRKKRLKNYIGWTRWTPNSYLMFYPSVRYTYIRFIKKIHGNLEVMRQT